MREVAQELARHGERPYVIPEGGSSALGSLGYVDAMAETRLQMDLAEADVPAQLDAVVHACGSGGTAAGVALGAALHGVAQSVLAMAVCDDAACFERVTSQLIADACALLSIPAREPPLTIVDRYKGPAYAVATREQLRFIAQIAQACGLILDPVYTGKAMYGLAQLANKPKTVLFIHTGGLPGVLAQGAELAAAATGLGPVVSEMW
jgi:D-cysteine desulfhydrase